MAMPRRVRILLAVAGLGIAGLAATLGVARQPGTAPAGEAWRTAASRATPGQLVIEESRGEGGRLPWPFVGVAALGLALAAFALWPRRPQNSSTEV